MRRVGALLGALALVAPLTAPAPAQDVRQTASGPVRVQLDSMPLGALATLLMRDVMRVPYVISGDVLNDTRSVSVNLVMPRSDLPVRVVQFLRSQGLVVALRGGTVYVSKPGGEAPGQFVTSAPMVTQAPPVGAPMQGSAPAPEPLPPPRPQVLAVVTPAFRSVNELSEVLGSVLPDLTLAAREGSEPDGTGIVDRLEPDRLVMSGPREVIDRAVDLVRLLDKPRPVVEIRAVVFEVRDTKSRSSALSLLVELGDFTLASNPLQVPGEQFLRIASGGLKAVLSATRGDGRFKIVAEPSLSARSGTVASLNSGSQVPTVGSVSYSEDGTPVKSIVYRDSGVTLKVRPIVRAGEIDLAVEQERSSFAVTDTGVDESPTLNRSVASAQITMAPGETVAIAGLDERAESDTRTGFFGGLLGTRDRDNAKGQLLLLIQADIALDQRKGELTVDYLGDEVDASAKS